MKRWLPILSLAGWFAFAFNAKAHEVRPAYLELRQIAPDTYDVFWKVPALGDERRLGIDVVLPAGTEHLSQPVGSFGEGAYVERSRIKHAGGLDGQTITIDGLKETQIDVLARVERSDGGTQTVRLFPDAPGFTVETTPSGWAVSKTYLVLGIEHILLGIDHLLFVLALVLLVKGWKRLLGTITAFTLAHSITLAAATLGLVHVPGPPVEACIALSIVFVASEVLHSRAGRTGVTERSPWVIAFTFGLLHGLGFASALSEVGLPSQAIPLALLFFNVGVELGQLAFITVVLGFMVLLRRVPAPLPRWADLIAPYTIGGLACFWFFQRVAAF